MPLEITVGPPQLAISAGNVVLLTDQDGQIISPGDKGIYFFDTRLISSWHIAAYAIGTNCSALALTRYSS